MGEVNSGGRPTKYKDEYGELAYKFCLLGATDERLADFFDVCVTTINTWKKEHPQFLASIKRGKAIADAEVASSLYQRALGYSHAETKIVSYEGKITDEKDVVKHYAPDPTAAIFWLKNRQPAQWRDKTEQVVTLSDDFDSLLDDVIDDN
ncbi:MAG TPA: hypothetical protein VIC51_11400 [Psychromonas sp.]